MFTDPDWQMADPLGFDSPTKDKWVKSGTLLRADQKAAGEDHQRDELTNQNFHGPSKADRAGTITYPPCTHRTITQVPTAEGSFIKPSLSRDSRAHVLCIELHQNGCKESAVQLIPGHTNTFTHMRLK